MDFLQDYIVSLIKSSQYVTWLFCDRILAKQDLQPGSDPTIAPHPFLLCYWLASQCPFCIYQFSFSSLNVGLFYQPSISPSPLFPHSSASRVFNSSPIPHTTCHPSWLGAVSKLHKHTFPSIIQVADGNIRQNQL